VTGNKVFSLLLVFIPRACIHSIRSPRAAAHSCVVSFAEYGIQDSLPVRRKQMNACYWSEKRKYFRTPCFCYFVGRFITNRTRYLSFSVLLIFFMFLSVFLMLQNWFGGEYLKFLFYSPLENCKICLKPMLLTNLD